jgi:hypothetical protein
MLENWRVDSARHLAAHVETTRSRYAQADAPQSLTSCAPRYLPGLPLFLARFQQIHPGREYRGAIEDKRERHSAVNGLGFVVMARRYALSSLSYTMLTPLLDASPGMRKPCSAFNSDKTDPLSSLSWPSDAQLALRPLFTTVSSIACSLSFLPWSAGRRETGPRKTGLTVV